MKIFLLIVFILSLTFTLPIYSGGKGCSGSSSCSTCKSCEGCKHCSKEGGTCGVCKKPTKKQKPPYSSLVRMNSHNTRLNFLLIAS